MKMVLEVQHVIKIQSVKVSILPCPLRSLPLSLSIYIPLVVSRSIHTVNVEKSNYNVQKFTSKHELISVRILVFRRPYANNIASPSNG